MCSTEEGGKRQWKCIDGTCDECRGVVFLKECPLQYGRHMVTWAQNVMTTVTAGSSGPGGAMEVATRSG